MASSILRSTPSTIPAASFRLSPSNHATVCNISSRRRLASRATSLSVRCEQSTKQDVGTGVWVGRLAMVSFTTAIAVEVSTGKGLLANLGLATPVPALAFAVTALVVGLLTFFLIQSGSRN